MGCPIKAIAYILCKDYYMHSQQWFHSNVDLFDQQPSSPDAENSPCGTWAGAWGRHTKFGLPIGKVFFADEPRVPTLSIAAYRLPAWDLIEVLHAGCKLYYHSYIKYKCQFFHQTIRWFDGVVGYHVSLTFCQRMIVH